MKHNETPGSSRSVAVTGRTQARHHFEPYTKLYTIYALPNSALSVLGQTLRLPCPLHLLRRLQSLPTLNRHVALRRASQS